MRAEQAHRVRGAVGVRVGGLTRVRQVRRREHRHRAVGRCAVTGVVELDPKRLVHERLERLADVQLLEDRGVGRVGVVEGEVVDAPWVGRLEVVVLVQCPGVLPRQRRAGLGEGRALVGRQVLRRYVADVDGLASLELEVLSGVGRERGHHQLVDGRRVRAGVLGVRDHRGTVVGGVVGA